VKGALESPQLLPHPLVVRDLSLHDVDGRPIVERVSFQVAAGTVFALIGESGSGKTSVALSLLGFARPGMRITGGHILIDGRDVLALSKIELRSYRGRVVSHVPQNPMASFSPRMTIGRHMAELLRAHDVNRAAIPERISHTLASVNLPNDRAFQHRYPFELSGGQLQRVAIGMACMTNPHVIVMDEPTTGLDVATQQTILKLIRRLIGASGVRLVYVTHDLAVVNAIADDVAVMQAGRVVEAGACRRIFAAPHHPYTQMLLATIPKLPDRACDAEAFPAMDETPEIKTPPVLAVADLRVFHGAIEVVHGIGFSILRGHCMALVGGSGSGKTSTGRFIAGLNSNGTGSLQFEGQALSIGLASRRRDQLTGMQIVFQNPDRSLNPREQVQHAIGRAARLARRSSAAAISADVKRLIDRVRLPRRVLSLYPADLSGGERQRVAIARALAMSPRLLICDEITSALDVSVQATVVELLTELKNDGLSMLFITHNLPLITDLAEFTLIMKDGGIVESGTTLDILSRPRDDYTRMLLAAAPRLDTTPVEETAFFR
jgi:peptide/nickel transport system ATP-binding protein